MSEKDRPAVASRGYADKNLSDEERAREFWRWFRSAPHADCRDVDCERELVVMLRAARSTSATPESVREEEDAPPDGYGDPASVPTIRLFERWLSLYTKLGKLAPHALKKETKAWLKAAKARSARSSAAQSERWLAVCRHCSLRVDIPLSRHEPCSNGALHDWMRVKDEARSASPQPATAAAEMSAGGHIVTLDMVLSAAGFTRADFPELAARSTDETRRYRALLAEAALLLRDTDPDSAEHAVRLAKTIDKTLRSTSASPVSPEVCTLLKAYRVKLLASGRSGKDGPLLRRASHIAQIEKILRDVGDPADAQLPEGFCELLVRAQERERCAKVIETAKDVRAALVPATSESEWPHHRLANSFVKKLCDALHDYESATARSEQAKVKP